MGYGGGEGYNVMARNIMFKIIERVKGTEKEKELRKSISNKVSISHHTDIPDRRFE